MLGSSSSLHKSGSARAIGLTIAAIILVAMWTPAVAHASGCTDSWTNTKGGSWFEGENWSKARPPTSEEEACIIASGTYEVTMTQTSATGSVSVKSLTIGGTSGTQTLLVGSSCSLGAVLATTGGITSGARGAITLTNGESCATSVTVTGPISNAGTLSTLAPIGGARTLQGNLTNTGQLAIDANTAYNDASALLTNEGAIDMAEGRQLTVEDGASVTNGSGGKIVATGNPVAFFQEHGTVAVGGTFTPAAITTKTAGDYLIVGVTSRGGRVPSEMTDSAGNVYEKDGSEADEGDVTVSLWSAKITSAEPTTITVHGLDEGELVDVTGAEITPLAEASRVDGSAAGRGTSEGTEISLATLTTGASSSDFVVVLCGAESATEEIPDINPSPQLQEIVGAEQEKLKAALLSALAPEGEAFTAKATVITPVGSRWVAIVVAYKQLAGTHGSAAGMGDVLVTGGTFTEGGGTTGGPRPVIVDDGTLAYTGAGISTIALRGASSLSGNIASGQSLSIESTCAENATASAGASFTNAGSITLTNFEACANNATLALASGTLTNGGTITTEAANGGQRNLQGSLTNTGTLAINANSTYSGASAPLTNDGVINVGAADTLNVSGAYSQAKKGTLQTAIDSVSSFGSMSVSGAASVGGALSLLVPKTFTGSLGQKFAILEGSSLSGTFSKEKEGAIKKSLPGLYYDPSYSASGVTLEVVQGTLALSKPEGAPGSSVTLSGSDYPAQATIKLTFTDDAGSKTTLASVKANASGSFSTEFTIPTDAAEGPGHFKAKSTIAGVSVTQAFKVS